MKFIVVWIVLRKIYQEREVASEQKTVSFTDFWNPIFYSPKIRETFLLNWRNFLFKVLIINLKTVQKTVVTWYFPSYSTSIQNDTRPYRILQNRLFHDSDKI
jgi:hypothetical protein